MVLVRALCHQQEKLLGLHQQSVSLTDGNTWSQLTALLTAHSQEVPILHALYTLFVAVRILMFLCHQLFIPTCQRQSQLTSPSHQLKIARVLHRPPVTARQKESGSVKNRRWVIIPLTGHLSHLALFGNSFLQWSINLQLFFPQSIYLEISSAAMLMNGQQTQIH